MEIEDASGGGGSNKGRSRYNESGLGASTAAVGAAYGGLNRGSCLVWEDLTVVIPNFGKGPTKRLLNGLHGFAEHGRIMAIMGPSGSGKSILLDSLAGIEKRVRVKDEKEEANL
ncbi:hypothetical protein QN277_007199 [Acacia crassicarpa]|uniref:ABC transporter domain-containing protein n=1 Tax=Acacia crassicarpa TaxID=499986 RepID=A0AAE1MF41_9FABA|nr:hypothetical protein QN277_007199 [Acacia crassicarpa]